MNNPPAFPRTGYWPDPLPGQERQDTITQPQEGLSLRDWFAGMAMQGIISDPQVTGDKAIIAKAAYGCADAMLKERDKIT